MAERVDIQTRLHGMAQVVSGLRSEEMAVRGLDQAVDRAGGSMERATRRSFLMNQALFTMRRYAYAATLGFTALFGVALRQGIHFNAMMQRNTVAFTYFLGSTQAAKAELEFLFDLARKTPFEFPYLADATRKFLAFGFNIKETNAMLTVMGDTISGLGLGQEEIDRFVLAIGQMLASGRVLGGELRQLEQLGIGARKILKEQLGLTSEQIGKIGELGLKATVAIPALMRGMREEFGGQAAALAQTYEGQLSTLRDNTNQMLGALTDSLFQWMSTGLLPFLNRVTTAMSDAMKTGGFGAAVEAMDEQIGAGGRLIAMWATLAEAGRFLGEIISGGVLPAFKDTTGVIGVLVKPILGSLIVAIRIASKFMWLWQAIVYVLVARFVLLRSIILAAKTATLLLAIATRIVRLVQLAYIEVLVAQRIATMVLATTTAALRGLWITTIITIQVLRLQTWRLLIATRTYNATVVIANALQRIAIALNLRSAFVWTVLTLAIARTYIVMGLLAIYTRIATTAMWLLNIAMYANPATWIALAVMVLVVALVILERRFGVVTKTIRFLYNWVKKNWKLLPLLLLGPMGIIIFGFVLLWRQFSGEAGKAIDYVMGLFGKLFDMLGKIGPLLGEVFHQVWLAIVNGFKTAINWVIGKWNNLEFKTPDVKILGVTVFPSFTIGTPDIPLLATGGNIASGGLAVVGDRGPELLALPGGARVEPLSSGPSIAERIRGSLGPVEITTQVFLDRRQIAEAVSEYQLDRMARA